VGGDSLLAPVAEGRTDGGCPQGGGLYGVEDQRGV